LKPNQLALQAEQLLKIELPIEEAGFAVAVLAVEKL
jgi:hypothetical protein